MSNLQDILNDSISKEELIQVFEQEEDQSCDYEFSTLENNNGSINDDHSDEADPIETYEVAVTIEDWKKMLN